MPPRRSDLRRDAPSRDRLLSSAKRLFAAHGYEQTATSAIARNARTSESQLMRYFGGKIGLLDALFDDAWAGLNTKVRALIEAERDSRGALLDVAELTVQMLGRDTDLATLLLFEGRRVRGRHGRVRISAGYLAFATAVEELVRRAQTDKQIDPSLDPSAVTSGILGAVEAMIRDRWLARTGSSRIAAGREITAVLKAMLAGFAARPPRRTPRR